MREKTMSRSKVRQHRRKKSGQTGDNLPRTEEKRQIISGSKAASMTKVCTAEHKTNVTSSCHPHSLAVPPAVTN